MEHQRFLVKVANIMLLSSNKETRVSHACSYEAFFAFYILNTPQVLSFSTPLFCPPHAICRPMPSTLRVCSGGMIPSSHSLADPKVASLSCSIRAFSAGSTFLPTASMTDESCSAPMTDVFALGQVNIRRGEYARPLDLC